jgi:hypothetical protein
MTGQDSEAKAALAAEALCWRCPSDHFTFETTEDLEALSEVIGQDRAVEAIRFAIGMRHSGYNLYALGPEGMGKHTAVRRFLEEQANQEVAPPDWCYVSNFKDRREPRALQLPAGRGRQLSEDMSHFVVDLRDTLRNGFESDEYRTRRKVIEEEFRNSRSGGKPPCRWSNGKAANKAWPSCARRWVSPSRRAAMARLSPRRRSKSSRRPNASASKRSSRACRKSCRTSCTRRRSG